MTWKQEKIMWMKINPTLGNNGDHTANSLDSRSVVVVRNQVSKTNKFALTIF